MIRTMKTTYIIGGLLLLLTGCRYSPTHREETEVIVEEIDTVSLAEPVDKYVGQPFLDMTLQTPDGTPGRLSDYAGKGKYTVVDFWASWCGPCRAAMPELIAIYNEYKDKGVDVVGISLDVDQAQWKEAIENLQIPWAQLSDLKGWEAAATTVYEVNAIPHLMLIAPDGTVIAKGLNDYTLRKKLEEIFD